MASKWDISIPYYISLVGYRTKDINQVPLVLCGVLDCGCVHPYALLCLPSGPSFLFYCFLFQSPSGPG